MKHKTFLNPLAFLIILATMIGASGCGNDDPEFLFEVDHAFNITIPAGQSTIESLVIPFENLTSQVTVELSKRGLTADDITAVHTSRARIDLVSFEGDLSDFRSVVTNVYSGPNPTLDPYEAGYTIQIKDQSTDRIDIVPSLTNLKEVMTRNIFNMELVLSYRRIALREMNARYTISFGVVQ